MCIRDRMANGVDVGVSSWRKPAPDTFPTLAKCGANYMNSQLAKLEACLLYTSIAINDFYFNSYNNFAGFF